MKKQANQFNLVSGFSILVCSLLFPTSLLGQGAPDIVWSRSDHTNAVKSVAFSQDGTLVASGSGDATIRVWKSTNGEPVITLTNGAIGVLQIAFVNNATLASWDLSNTLRLWQLPDGAITRTQPISGVWGGTAFSERAGLFAVAGYELNTRFLRVFRVENGSVLQSFIGDFPRPSVSPDGQRVAAAQSLVEEYRIPLWRLDTGSLERTFTNVECCFSAGAAPTFSFDGKILAVPPAPYGVTEFWNAEDGAYLGAIFDYHPAPPGNKIAKFLAFTPDGQLLISVNNFDVTRFWQTTRLSPQRRLETSLAIYDQEPVGIRTMAVSPKGGLYAYGREDGKVIMARVPVFITETRFSSGQFVVQWAGGSGLYQLQQRADLTMGTWQDVGAPTTATGVTNIISGATLFYRVQSLPN